MFANVCTACHKHLLIFPSQIVSMDNTERGIVVTYVCWCDAEQTWLSGTGASKAAAAA